MTNTDEMIRAIGQNAGDIRRDFGVARLGVFGSHARGDATADSDLDVLVEFETDLPELHGSEALSRTVAWRDS
jgi:predicted nucleotidyltransferase